MKQNYLLQGRGLPTVRITGILLLVVILCLSEKTVKGQSTQILTGNVVRLPTSSDTKFIVPGKTDVHFTSDVPYINSSVALNSNDAWLFFDNVRPSEVISKWLTTVTVNSAPAKVNSNIRISVYKNGTAVIPNGNLTSDSALKVFTKTGYAGTGKTYAIEAINNSLGDMDNKIRSFILKRGYMATMANNTDGTGYSRVYIANDSDITVPVMPWQLDTTVSFIRVVKWDWPSKKGKAGWDPGKIGATWYYNWNIDGNSTASDYGYCAIRQTLYWPDWNAISSKPNVSHILGYNEPDRPDQANLSVDQALGGWPAIYGTGLRVGSPAPASFWSGWLSEFLAKSDALNYRIDYVAIHCYWGGLTPQQWYDNLKYIHDQVRRPLWITEWNNGANWTEEWWPADQGAQFQKQLADMKGILQVLDTTSFIERYAEYDWVEDKRALVLGDTLTPTGKYYYSNKSDLAYRPSNEFIQPWNLIAPALQSALVDTNYLLGTLRWKDDNGELGSRYVLERKIQGRDNGFVRIQNYQGYEANKVFTFVDSVYGRATYRVRAYAKDTSLSVYSSLVDVFRDAAVKAPGPLVAKAVSPYRVQLSWASPNANARSYTLRRASSASGPFDTIAARTTNISFSDSTVAPGNLYYYTVTAMNSAGEVTSPAVTVTTPALIAPPAVISPRAASGDAATILTWAFQYDVKYKIARSVSQVGTYDTIASNIGAYTGRYVDNGRENGKSYFYKIITYNEAGLTSSTPLLASPMYGQHINLAFNDTAVSLAEDVWGGYHALFASPAAIRGAGYTGQALRLDGSADSYAGLGAGAVGGLNDFTVSSWVKANSLATWMRVFDFGSSTSNYMFLSVQGTGGTIRYAITTNGTEQGLEFNYAFPLNTWVHLAVTQSGQTVKMYINGSLVATSGNIHLHPKDLGITTNNYLGKSQWPDPNLDGSIDEFRIYNYSLSPENVNELYNDKPFSLPKPPGITASPRAASGDGKSALTWASESNSRYKILRSASLDGTYDTIANNLSSSRYVDNGLTNGTKVYYKIIAFNRGGNGPATAPLPASPMYGQHINLAFDDTASSLAEDVWGGYHALFASPAAIRGAGHTGQALKLDGSTDSYASLGAGAVEGLNDFTISSWVKASSLATWMRVFDFGSSTSNYMFLSVQGTGGTVRYAITTDGKEQGLEFNYAFPLNAWVHLAVTQSGQTVKMYINGSLVATSEDIHLHPKDLGITTNNYLGKSQWPDPNLDGLIDEFRIYNYSLSGEDITRVYNGQALPIKLVNFSGMSMAEGNELSWRISSGEHAILMDLQRSENGSDFATLYSLKATIRETGNVFNFIDKKVASSTSYYRLKMTDPDGTVGYSPVLTLDRDFNSDLTVRLYPTVVNSTAYLSVYTSKAMTIKTIITGVSGQILKVGSHALLPGSNIIPIDASKITSGIYTISIFDAAKKISTVRFIVNK